MNAEVYDDDPVDPSLPANTGHPVKGLDGWRHPRDMRALDKFEKLQEKVEPDDYDYDL